MNRCLVGVACVASVFLSAIPAQVQAQPLNFRVEVSPFSMPPLHSYAMGESGDWYLFFAGISGMGRHSLTAGGPAGTLPPSFPVNVFNRTVIAFNHQTGQTLTSPINHLPAAVQLALTVTNVASVQFDTTLLMYGGMGPIADNSDWNTRDTVTSIDLPAVLAALQAGSLAPASAFTVQTAPDARVAGGIIVKMGPAGRQYVLIGGALFIGDYAGNTLFLNFYSEKAQIYDFDISVTTPTQTLTSFSLHRRDMNALPMTYPDGIGGVTTGFAIAGGVFQNGFFVWENPLYYRQGDPQVTDEFVFQQKMNQYESGALSFYSASLDENRQILFGGISDHHYANGAFVPDVLVPWVADITQVRVQSGVYLDETVLGQTPLPTTNTILAPLNTIPRFPNGQINMDALPANEVLIARIPAGLRAAMPAGSPFTFASGDLYNVYVTLGVRGDINRDGVVDGADLAALLTNWGSTNATVPDLNFDGVINGVDLATLLTLWGNNTPG